MYVSRWRLVWRHSDLYLPPTSRGDFRSTGFLPLLTWVLFIFINRSTFNLFFFFLVIVLLLKKNHIRRVSGDYIFEAVGKILIISFFITPFAKRFSCSPLPSSPFLLSLCPYLYQKEEESLDGWVWEAMGAGRGRTPRFFSGIIRWMIKFLRLDLAAFLDFGLEVFL